MSRRRADRRALPPLPMLHREQRRAEVVEALHRMQIDPEPLHELPVPPLARVGDRGLVELSEGWGAVASPARRRRLVMNTGRVAQAGITSASQCAPDPTPRLPK